MVLVSPRDDLLDRFNLELFGVALAAHTQTPDLFALV